MSQTLSNLHAGNNFPPSGSQSPLQCSHKLNRLCGYLQERPNLKQMSHLTKGKKALFGELQRDSGSLAPGSPEAEPTGMAGPGKV